MFENVVVWGERGGGEHRAEDGVGGVVEGITRYQGPCFKEIIKIQQKILNTFPVVERKPEWSKTKPLLRTKVGFRNYSKRRLCIF
jgi:hypothetical protein